MNNLYPWQQESWQSLNGLRTRLPNALLIKGAKGIGKQEMAVNFAQSLLCDAPLASGLPCCECDSCRWFEQGSHPDFRLVQPDALNDTEESGEKENKKKSKSSGLKSIQRRIQVMVRAQMQTAQTLVVEVRNK